MDGQVSVKYFFKQNMHTTATMSVSIELKSGELLEWDEFQRRYDNLQDLLDGVK